MSLLSNQAIAAQALPQFADVLPDDPYTTHSCPGNRTHQDIVDEKRFYSALMQERVKQFEPGISQELANASIELMHQLHHNQFRGGELIRHFTHHTSQVSLRASSIAEEQSASRDFRPIKANDGTLIAPEVIAFVLGAFHDGIEDYHENYRGTKYEVPVERASQVAESRILQMLLEYFEFDTSQYLTKCVKSLSIYNADEFATNSYVNGIVDNFYTHCVKQADIQHNLETFPDYTPTYPILIVPAQYQPIFKGTSVEDSYYEGLILNLAKLDYNEMVPYKVNHNPVPIRSADRVLNLFDKYNEPEAPMRIYNFYAEMRESLEHGRFDSFLESHSLSTSLIAEKIVLAQQLVHKPDGFESLVLPHY